MPQHADIVAAFLYVQTAESVQGSGINLAKFNGYALGPFTAAGLEEPRLGHVCETLGGLGKRPEALLERGRSRWPQAHDVPGGRAALPAHRRGDQEAGRWTARFR